MMSNKSIANILTFAGITPFLAGVFLSMTDNALWGITGKWIFISYSALILSFMSGIHWGITLVNPNHRSLLIESSILSVAAWFVVLFKFKYGMLITLACYIYLIYIDSALIPSSNIPDWYWTLRKQVTLLVIALHCLFLLFTA